MELSVLTRGLEHSVDLRRDSERVAVWLLAFVPIVYLALSGGGYDLIVRSEVGIAVWWFILFGALTGILPRARLGAAAWAALALLAGYLVWTWIAVRWSRSDELTLVEVARIGTYLGVLALGLCAVRAGTARTLLNGAASAIGLLATLAVAYRLAPSLFPADTGARFFGVRQLQWPFEYADAVGEFMAAGLPLLLAVAVSGRTRAGRLGAAAGLVLAGVCVLLTASQGGMLAAAVGLFVLALLGPRHDWLPRSHRRRLVALVAAGFALAVGMAIVTGLAHHLLVHFEQPQIGGQFSFSGSHRYQYWQAAVHAFESNPGHGIGPGTFQFYWAQHNSLGEFVLNAHSVYFETLAELGIVGVILVAGFFATVLICTGRRAFGLAGPERVTVSAAGAGVAGFCAAAAFDWVWQIGAVPVVAMLLAGVIVGRSDRDPVRVGSGVLTRVVFAAAAIAALWAIVLPLATTVAVRKSQAAASARDYRVSLADAATAQRLEPGAAGPPLQRALVLEQLGEPGAALRAVGQARAREPTNWRIWLVASRLATEADRPLQALTDYRHARSLNPTSRLFTEPSRLVPISSMPPAARLVPPGKAGANQYVEMIPGAAGNLAPAGGASTVGFDPRSFTGLGGGEAGASALARLGASGRAAAEVAAATALSLGPPDSRYRPGPPPAGDPPALAIASVLGGSDAGGLGAILPLLLVVVLVAATAAAVTRRRA